MSENYELSRPLPSAVLKASAILKLAGNIGFWFQLILGVVAALILLFASTGLIGGQQSSQGSDFGILCAAAGIVALAVSVFFFFRYGKIAQLIQDPTLGQRPSRSYTLQVIRLGLTANLVGMLLSIIGAESFVGLVLGKTLSIPQGAAVYNTAQLVQPKDLFIILANTHTIASHFTGIVVALWLLNRLNK